MLNGRLLSAILLFSVFAVPFASPATHAPADDHDALAALQKKVAEQDLEIAGLQRQVRALMQMLQARSTPAATPLPSPSAEPKAPLPAASATVQAAVPPPARPAEVAASRPETSVTFGGDVYLYQFAPMGVSGESPKFELYALSALIDGKRGNWGIHVDYRFRTTKLRSFFPGNTWLQQGYVSYTTPLGDFKAGSFYRRVGLVWDGSFFGNLQYFDGLKLDPEFGVGFEGSHRLSDRWGSEYSIQYFASDARINGSLPGRDFVSEPGASSKNDVTARFAPVLRLGDDTSLTVGGSYAHGVIDRNGGPSNQRQQWAADATLQTGPLLTYGELLNQSVSGQVVMAPQDADYGLAGIRWTRGRYQPRLNFSQANYHGLNPHREYILQPGVTVDLAEGFSFLTEYDFWRSLTALQKTTVDRSLNLVLAYHF